MGIRCQRPELTLFNSSRRRQGWLLHSAIAGQSTPNELLDSPPPTAPVSITLRESLPLGSTYDPSDQWRGQVTISTRFYSPSTDLGLSSNRALYFPYRLNQAFR